MIFSEPVVNYKTFKMSFCSAKNSLLYCVQLCLILCNPMDCSPPGSSVHGISQARVLEWVAIPFSRGSSQSRDWTQVSCIAGRFFTIVWTTRGALSVSILIRLVLFDHLLLEDSEKPPAPLLLREVWPGIVFNCSVRVPQGYPDFLLLVSLLISCVICFIYLVNFIGIYLLIIYYSF